MNKILKTCVGVVLLLSVAAATSITPYIPPFPGDSTKFLRGDATWGVPSGSGGAAVDAQYVTLTSNGTLTQERVLTGTANQITVTDGGAGAAVTLATPQNIHTTATPQFGGLGIGVAASTLPLRISKAGTTLLGTANRGLQVVQDDTNFRGVSLGYDTSGQIGVVSSDSGGTASTLTFWLYSGSAWQERLRINPTGTMQLKLGGTTLSGTAARTFQAVQDTTAFRGVSLGYDTADQIGIISSDTGGTASQLAFWTYNGTAWAERMRIDETGQLGIFTANPSATLDVNGTARVQSGFVNTTFDAAGTGNVLKSRKYLYFGLVDTVDGVGATIQTAASELKNRAIFSHSADQAANWGLWNFPAVPEDLDTAVDLKIERFKFVLGGADTGTHRYVISMYSGADSAIDYTTTINAINLDFAGDASGANADMETISNVTLTGWRTSLTAGNSFFIKVARDGDAAQDTSTVNSWLSGFVISYTSSQ